MFAPWSSRRVGVLLACLVFLLSFSAPGGAFAQGDDEARQHFRLGQAHYDNGNFAEAAREFQQAYDLSGRSQLLYNVYLAHRDALQTSEARDALRQYLEEVPNPPDEDRLRARLHHLNEALANQPEPQADPVTPDPDPVRPEAAPTSSEPDTPQPSQTPDTVRPEPQPEASSSPVPWVLVGAGGALLVGGLVAGGISRSAHSDLESLCPDGACPPDSDWEATRDRGQRSARIGDSFVILGLATAATGVVLYFVMKPDDDDTQAARVRGGVACDDTGCLAAVGGTF